MIRLGNGYPHSSHRMSMAVAITMTIGALSAAAQEFELGVQNVAYVEVKGVVRDGSTSSPIAGANVLAVWTATSYGYHSSTQHCLRIAAGQTDAEGRFSITAPAGDVFRRGLAQQYVDIRIYKAGWREQPSDNDEDGRVMRMEEEKRPSIAALTQGGLLTQRRIVLTARMHHSRQDPHERLRAVRRLANRAMDCESTGNQEAVQSYFDAIANEANRLANTRYEKALAAVLKARAHTALGSVQSAHDVESAIMQAAYLTPDMDDLDWRDRADKTVLMKAAEAGDVADVARLLRKGANPNRTRSAGDLIAGDSALTFAIQGYGWANVDRKPGAEKYIAAIETLLRHSSTDPNLRDRHIDYTPLMKALERGQDDVVALLLSAGADPNLTAYGKQFSALQIAAKRAASGNNSAGVPMPGATNQFRILLASKRIDLNMPTTYDGQTALTEAASLALPLIVRQLLEAGADPNAPDLGKRTPLIAITENALLNPTRPNYIETFRLIASWPGVRIDATYKGKTALQMIQEARRTDLAQILVEKSR